MSPWVAQSLITIISDSVQVCLMLSNPGVGDDRIMLEVHTLCGYEHRPPFTPSLVPPSSPLGIRPAIYASIHFGGPE
jgi:hypothetical protein